MAFAADSISSRHLLLASTVGVFQLVLVPKTDTFFDVFSTTLSPAFILQILNPSHLLLNFILTRCHE